MTKMDIGKLARHSLGALLLAFLLGANPAQAASPSGTDPTYASCMAKAVSSADMLTCQQAARTNVEQRLGSAYAQALKELAPDQQMALRDSERLWIAFRQHDCMVFHGKDVGSQAAVAAGDCMIDRAEKRISDLKGFSP